MTSSTKHSSRHTLGQEPEHDTVPEDALRTMLKCYDQPDGADLLAVTSEPRKRRELSISQPA